jgi:hypothetical protein
MIHKRIYNKHLNESQVKIFVKNINKLENVQAISINHDGITGTMTNVVNDDLIAMVTK